MHWIWIAVIGWVSFLAGYIVRVIMEGLSKRYPKLPEDARPYHGAELRRVRFVPRGRGD